MAKKIVFAAFFIGLIVISATLAEDAAVATPQIIQAEELSLADWPSMAKNSHNNRIADSAIAPPLKIKWEREALGEYGFSRLLYSGGKLFEVRDTAYCPDKTSYVCIGPTGAAYDPETGDKLWQYTWTGHTYAGTVSSVVAGGFLWGGTDHARFYKVDVNSGDVWGVSSHGGPGIMDRYANIHSSGIYASGANGIDATTLTLKAIDLVYGPLVKPVPDGKIDGALEFPGIYGGQDYLDLGDKFDPGAGDWTVMGWFKRTESGSPNYIFSKQPNDYTYNSTFFMWAWGGRVQYHLGPGFSANVYGGDSFSCALNEWCHFALTYDHAKERLYKNGALVFERERSGSDRGAGDRDLGGNSEPFYIGGRKTKDSFGGSLDEFAIFSKALSPAEIAGAYGKEIAPDASTQLLLHFDNKPELGESERLFYDSSGKGNHAAYHGYTTAKTRWSKGFIGAALPAIDGNLVYFPMGTLYAFNAADGNTAWKQGAEHQTAALGERVHLTAIYADGAVYSIGYPKSVGTPPTMLYAYDAKTGGRLFEISLPQETPDPTIQVIVSGNVAYLSTPARVLAIRIPGGEKIWDHNRSCKYSTDCTRAVSSGVGDIVLAGDVLYAIDHFKNKIVGLDRMTGAKVWQFSLADEFMALPRFTSLIAVGNTIFARSYNGKLFAFEQGYSNPRITNDKETMATGQVGTEYKISRSGAIGSPYMFEVFDGQPPFSWQIAAGSLPPGLKLVPDADNQLAMLSGTPTAAGEYAFTVKATDAMGNSDSRQFRIRIMPDSLALSKVLQNGLGVYSGCEDVYISSPNPNSNYGAGAILQSRNASWFERPLVRFKIFKSEGGPVPDDAIILSAELSLRKKEAQASKVNVFELLKPWDEATATWKKAAADLDWNAPGAAAIGLDRGEKIAEWDFESTEKVRVGWWQFISQPKFTEKIEVTPLLQRFQAGGENNGWLLEILTSAMDIYSCNDANAERKPKLTIWYKRYSEANLPPVARIYANPSTVLTGTQLTLDASETYDPDGEIISFTWGNAATCVWANPAVQTMQCKRTFALPIISAGLTSYTFSDWFEAYDDYGTKNRATVNITVVKSFAKATIATSMLRTGRKNTAYSDKVFVAGGTAPYARQVVSGSLPPGLSMSSATGEISGAPTATGNYALTVRVTDASGAFDQKALSIEVRDETGAACTDGQTRQCGTSNIGECKFGTEACVGGIWASCVGNIEPSLETCDGKDNDCDSTVDDNLSAPLCPLQAGICKNSTKRCGGTTGWLDCNAASYGANYEANETKCSDALDNDCDSTADNADSDCLTTPAYPAVTKITLNKWNNHGRTASSIEPSGYGIKSIDIELSKPVNFDQSSILIQPVSFPNGAEKIGHTLVPSSINGSDTTAMRIELYHTCSAEDSWCNRTDINKDGRVDLNDYDIIDFEFLFSTVCAEANGWCNGADITKDGKIDDADYSIINTYFSIPTATVADTWIKITLDSRNIRNISGGQLDGEPSAGGSGLDYIYSAADLPSGNNVPGGNAVFYVGSLRGDFCGKIVDDSALPNGIIAADDVNCFQAVYQKKDIDADFAGAGSASNPMPDGTIDSRDLDQFNLLHKAALEAGKRLDPLPQKKTAALPAAAPPLRGFSAMVISIGAAAAIIVALAATALRIRTSRRK